MKDYHGRTYAQLSTLKQGDLVQVDNGFTCIGKWQIRKVFEDAHGKFIPCRAGRHYLDGQLADKGDSLIGVYPY